MAEEKLRKELANLKKAPLSDLCYSIELIQNNIFNWRLTLVGPKDTPYADGIFFIKLKFPSNYPHEPPEIFFLTPIYHMSVYQDGRIDRLFFKCDWKETISIREIITKLSSFFYLVLPDSPCCRDKAELYKKDREKYFSNAREYTLKYANTYSYEDFKKFYEWNYSIKADDSRESSKAKNIRLSCNLNGNDSCVVEFNSSELTRVVVERVFMYQKFRPQSDILCICNNRKINLDKTLEENGLEDQNHITIISSNSPFSSI